jgi:hypothetical protein
MFSTFLFNEPVFNIGIPPSRHHYCLDGSYRILSGNVNHSFVIARGPGEDFIYGQDKNDIELGLVGERLDFKLLTALDTKEEAESAAAAIQAGVRLNTAGGFIIVHPNCGVELWDVIRVHDGTSDGDGSCFRVSAVNLIWYSAAGQYLHRLSLCAV